jgi:hypothetical protein
MQPNSTETSALGEADVIQPSTQLDRIADANRLLDLTFPPGVEGIVAAPTGTPTAGEKYLPDWREHFFEWPAQRNALLAHIFQAVADDREVYLCGSVFNDPPAGRRRKKFAFKESWTIRVDFDGTETEEIRRRAAKLGAGTINSGTDGHLHLWVRLAEPIRNPAEYEYYWRKITGKLEVAGTEKCAAVDVLRIPGTNNHKRRVLAGGDPTPVTWDESPADPITLAELAERLQCPLWNAAEPSQNGAERHARASGSAGWGDESPIDLASHPKAPALLKALTTPTLKADGKPDRSTTFYNLVETAVFCGLDDAQIRWYVRQQTDVARRLDQRGPARIPSTSSRTVNQCSRVAVTLTY